MRLDASVGTTTFQSSRRSLMQPSHTPPGPTNHAHCAGHGPNNHQKASLQSVTVFLLVQIDRTTRDIFYYDPGLFGTQARVDSCVDSLAFTMSVTRSDLNIVSCVYTNPVRMCRSERCRHPLRKDSASATLPFSATERPYWMDCPTKRSVRLCEYDPGSFLMLLVRVRSFPPSSRVTLFWRAMFGVCLWLKKTWVASSYRKPTRATDMVAGRVPFNGHFRSVACST